MVKDNPSPSSKIVQHIQHDLFSLIIVRKDRRTLNIHWEQVHENYQIKIWELEAALKAIKNNSEMYKVGLLIDAYEGISFDKETLKFVQTKENLENLSAVAVVLKSSTQRLSLNLYASFNRVGIPIRGFMNRDYAEQWLRKKQLQFLKKK